MSVTASRGFLPSSIKFSQLFLILTRSVRSLRFGAPFVSSGKGGGGTKGGYVSRCTTVACEVFSIALRCWSKGGRREINVLGGWERDLGCRA